MGLGALESNSPDGVGGCLVRFRLVWFGMVWYGLVWFGIVGIGHIRLYSEYNGPRCSRKYFPGWVGWVVGKLGIKANLRSFGLDL